MNTAPRVSIIVTSYNIEEYIHECLCSIERQTFRDFEVIIVDDGSTDDTFVIEQDFCCNKSNYSFIRQENAGVSVARNQGLDYASGDFIVFVDGDDYLDSKAIHEFVERIGEADILCTCCHAFDDESAHEEPFFDKSYRMVGLEQKQRLFLQLLNGNLGKPSGKGSTAIGVPWGKLYRRSLLDQHSIRFNPNLIRMQDNMFNMYAFYHAHCVVYINEAFYNYRLNHIQARATRYNPSIWKELLKARDAFFYQYPEIDEGEIHKAYLYEKYIGLAASAEYISNELEWRAAIKGLARLRDDPLFAIIRNAESCEGIPRKLVYIERLINYRLYHAVVLGLRMHNTFSYAKLKHA